MKYENFYDKRLVVSIDGIELLVDHAEVTIDGFIPGMYFPEENGSHYVVHPSKAIRKLHLVIDITDKEVDMEYKYK
jgi:hypothetical protein